MKLTFHLFYQLKRLQGLTHDGHIINTFYLIQNMYMKSLTLTLAKEYKQDFEEVKKYVELIELQSYHIYFYLVYFKFKFTNHTFPSFFIISFSPPQLALIFILLKQLNLEYLDILLILGACILRN